MMDLVSLVLHKDWECCSVIFVSNNANKNIYSWVIIIIFYLFF